MGLKLLPRLVQDFPCPDYLSEISIASLVAGSLISPWNLRSLLLATRLADFFLLSVVC